MDTWRTLSRGHHHNNEKGKKLLVLARIFALPVHLLLPLLLLQLPLQPPDQQGLDGGVGLGRFATQRLRSRFFFALKVILDVLKQKYFGLVTRRLLTNSAFSTARTSALRWCTAPDHIKHVFEQVDRAFLAKNKFSSRYSNLAHLAISVTVKISPWPPNQKQLHKKSTGRLCQNNLG